MNFFWVNLGGSYDEVLEHKFLWAPQFSFNEVKETKYVNVGWSAVAKVKKGDLIFCYRNGEILRLAKALSDCYPADRPQSLTFDKWQKEGWKVDVELTKIPDPIKADEFKDFFIENYNTQCIPKVFTSKKQCAQFYMSAIPSAAGVLLLSHIQSTAYIVDNFDMPDNAIEKEDVADRETVREIVIKARIGQGPYRKNLIDIWNGKCSATGLSYTELLIASHIVPWSVCEPSSERIDPYNGFLLSPNIDKLFDKGLISFTDEGKLLLNESITDEVLDKLGISKSLQISAIKPQNLPYLARHREMFKF